MHETPCLASTAPANRLIVIASPSRAVFLGVEHTRALSRRGRATLVDARSHRAFTEGHLPGAVHWAARDLNPTASGVRRLAPAARVAAALRERGLGADPVVIYGGRGGADAAHLWWTLRTYGHPAAYLLDGGVEAWLHHGLPLERTAPEDAARPPAPPTPFAPRFDPTSLVELPELRRRLQRGPPRLLDTRDLSEYSGELAAAARGGHIPGATHVEWRTALTEDGALKPDSELREVLAGALEAPEVVTYCQSGVRAAHTVAVLTHLGHPHARLYLASWGEWGNREDTPVDPHCAEEVRT